MGRCSATSNRACAAAAQQQPAAAGADTLSVERIEQLKQQSAESSDLDDETKGSVAELYQQALKAVQQAAELSQRNASHRAKTETARGRAEQLKASVEFWKAVRQPSIKALIL